MQQQDGEGEWGGQGVREERLDSLHYSASQPGGGFTS